MANITDYIDWRGDISLDVSPFNDIDALVFTQLVMIELDDIIPQQLSDGSISLENAAKLYFGKYSDRQSRIGLMFSPETFDLFEKAANSKRFKDLNLCGFVHYTNLENEEQFAAMTVRIGDGSFLIVYRGTDDTIVGWKEDFNMSFTFPVPSQLEAVTYIEAISSKIRGKLRVAGHSKGGNLSLYAATKCSQKVQKRIISVCNFDGPGFSKEFLELPEYQALDGKILSLLPQSSIVGMLLENDNKYQVVQSTETGIMQHSAFSWNVLGTNFVLLHDLTRESRDIAKVLHTYMDTADVEHRKKFVNAVYEILTSTKATTLTELNENKYSILRSLKNTDKETRNLVIKTLGFIFSQGSKQFVANVLDSVFKPKKKETTAALEAPNEPNKIEKIEKTTKNQK